MAGITTVHPAQNHNYTATTLESHPHACPTGVNLPRRQVSVPWIIKPVTNLSRYNAQREKTLSLCRHRACSIGRPGAGNWSTRAQKATAPSAFSHDVCQRPRERPCPVLCPRNWRHCSSGEGSLILYLKCCFVA